jgi:hypothetical protein
LNARQGFCELYCTSDTVEKYLIPDFTGEACGWSAAEYDDIRAVLCNSLQALLTQRFIKMDEMSLTGLWTTRNPTSRSANAAASADS